MFKGYRLSNRYTFLHQAMATTFKITIVHDESDYARQAAATAFAELDRIEGRLSRHVEHSDIARINRLAGGQATLVHLDTFDGLRIALSMQRETGGAFDVAYGSASPVANGPRFELDADGHRVRVMSAGVRLDLGGIGKGFALDRLAALLDDWEVESALLCASTSTLLAGGSPPGEGGWPVSVGPAHDRRQLRLAKRSLSGSGTAVQGRHLIDPRSRQPADRRLGAWAGAPTGAVSDALSTAFMIMTEDEIRGYCRQHADVSAYLWRSQSEPTVTIAEERNA